MGTPINMRVTCAKKGIHVQIRSMANIITYTASPVSKKKRKYTNWRVFSEEKRNFSRRKTVQTRHEERRIKIFEMKKCRCAPVFERPFAE